MIGAGLPPNGETEALSAVIAVCSFQARYFGLAPKADPGERTGAISGDNAPAKLKMLL